MSCWLENPPILNQKFPLGQLKYSEYISSWVLITSIITESGIGLERDFKIEFLLWTFQSSYRVLMPCAASPSLLSPVTSDWGCSSLHPWVLIAPKSHSLITEYQQALGNIFWSSTETWASTAVLGHVWEHPLCLSYSLWWGLSFWLWLQPLPAHGVALGALEEVDFFIGSGETVAGESQRPLLVPAGTGQMPLRGKYPGRRV